MSYNRNEQQAQAGQREQRCANLSEYPFWPGDPRVYGVVDKDQRPRCADQSNDLNQVYPLVKPSIEDPDVLETVDQQSGKRCQKGYIKRADQPNSKPEPALALSEFELAAVVSSDKRSNRP